MAAERRCLLRAHYYSPRLDRDLIAMLFRKRRKRRIPMTKLDSGLVRAAPRYEGVIANESTDRIQPCDGTTPLKRKCAIKLHGGRSRPKICNGKRLH
jgi:hypothetical protein